MTSFSGRSVNGNSAVRRAGHPPPAVCVSIIVAKIVPSGIDDDLSLYDTGVPASAVGGTARSKASTIFDGTVSTSCSCAKNCACFHRNPCFSVRSMFSGYKTKVLITEINNRHLNTNTKHELQLFLKQMNQQSIDITACDCFTLNSHLVASVIAVSTTYLFILIQFHSVIN